MRESSPGHAREVDVRLSRQLARVMDDAVTVLGIWLLWRWVT